ncbi:hypothetical protein ACFCXT_09815 [Streptomyces vinaceus]|uniref:hypothetical protein n=1 Tax=Streptomyces vinaceus TaxID=1960 RepID=UPI0035E2CD73
MVEEELALLPRHRPTLCLALVIHEVFATAAVVEDRRRVSAEPFQADVSPPVDRVEQVVHEQAHSPLVGAERRLGAVVLHHQVGHPLVDVGGRPAPRVLIREVPEPLNDPLAPGSRSGLEAAAANLLPCPARHHRVKYGVLGMQQMHPGNQLKPRGPLHFPRTVGHSRLSHQRAESGSND